MGSALLLLLLVQLLLLLSADGTCLLLAFPEGRPADPPEPERLGGSRVSADRVALPINLGRNFFLFFSFLLNLAPLKLP